MKTRARFDAGDDYEKRLLLSFESALGLTTGPTKQHYVTKSYLKRFCRSRGGTLWVYDRDKNEYRQQSTNSTAVERDIYTFVDPAGHKRYDVEQFFAVIEGKVADVIEAVDAGNDLTAEQAEWLAVFVAAAYVRTPDHLESGKYVRAAMLRETVKVALGTEVAAARTLASVAQEAGPPTAVTAKELADFVTGDQYEIEVDHQHAVAQAIGLIAKLVDIFMARNWVLLHPKNEKGSFITGDSPVGLASATQDCSPWRGLGFGSPHAVTIMPLSQRTCLLMYGNGLTTTYRTALPEKVRRTNLVMAEHCKRFLFARDRELLVSLVKATGIAKRKWSPKFKIG